MLHRVTGQGIGHQGEPIGRQRVRNDEDAVVRALVREVLDGEANEVVPVARDQAAPFLLGPLELLPIRLSFGPGLMDADGIETPLPKQFGYSGAEVLVEVELHGRFTANDGC